MRATFLCSLFVAMAAFLGCDRSSGKLDELDWGRPFDADFDVLVARASYILQRRFELGFDPDLTDEKKGEFMTVWHYRMATYYRDSKRNKAHVTIEDVGEGQCRIGVSVVTQLNDNIDNPSVKEEARWVSTTRDVEWASRLEATIARRYIKVQPSELWKEKHSDTKRGTMRPDILDRNKDVNLEELNDPNAPGKEAPATTGTDAHRQKGKG